ncbi:MAG TPA: hypothetical protein VEP90_26800 [Methylomirabilota bacterium]|nr:hypothetical protein [Methylomirabilota bacterium]
MAGSATPVEILQYCEPSDAVSREQYFLDLFKPKYNILTTAGSFLGYKHLEKTLIKMRERSCSEGTRAKMSHSRSDKIKVKVTDLGWLRQPPTNISTTYHSANAVASALNISRPAISMYFKRNQIKPYKGRYLFNNRLFFFLGLFPLALVITFSQAVLEIVISFVQAQVFLVLTASYINLLSSFISILSLLKNRV